MPEPAPPEAADVGQRSTMPPPSEEANEAEALAFYLQMGWALESSCRAWQPSAFEAAERAHSLKGKRATPVTAEPPEILDLARKVGQKSKTPPKPSSSKAEAALKPNPQEAESPAADVRPGSSSGKVGAPASVAPQGSPATADAAAPIVDSAVSKARAPETCARCLEPCAPGSTCRVPHPAHLGDQVCAYTTKCPNGDFGLSRCYSCRACKQSYDVVNSHL